MFQIDGVQGVHEFHVWQLTGDRLVASAHVRFHAAHEFMNILGKIKALFHNEGIHSVTIQPEYSEVGISYMIELCSVKWGGGGALYLCENCWLVSVCYADSSQNLLISCQTSRKHFGKRRNCS